MDELDACPKSWFHYIHLCDCPAPIPTDQESLVHTGRCERLYPGEGAIPIREIVAKLPDAVRGVEVPHFSRVQEMGYEAHARQALSCAKDCLKNL